MFDAVSIDNCRLLIQTLAHSLWQAGFIAICCWLALRSLPARKTTVRYGVACLGLAFVVFATLITTSVVVDQQNESATLAAASQHSLHTESSPVRSADFESLPRHRVEVSHETDPAGISIPEPGFADRSLQRSTADRALSNPASEYTWSAVLAGIWGLGVLIMLLRFIRVIATVRYLQSRETLVEESLLNQLQELISDLSHRMNLRWPVRLVVSDNVSVPGIVGTFWPALLMPPAMLTGVPLEQLRIVIAHELAHVKRFDFLVNLGQLLVESLLFFNPAVWWLSRQIRIEREACCDAIAVSATGSAVPVARTLLAIVERLGESVRSDSIVQTPVTAGLQAFSGSEPPDQPTPLFDRVRRILTPDQRPHIRIPWYSFLAVIAVYALVSLGLYEGADATVQAVQRVLSPKERIDRIEQLVAERDKLTRSNSGDPNNRTPPPKKEVTVSGTIRTYDGSPVPAGIGLSGDVLTELEKSTSHNTQFYTRFAEPAVEHRFEEQVSCLENRRDGTSHLFVHVEPENGKPPSYAPATFGPFELTSGKLPKSIELVLKPGFNANVLVVSETGRPVADAYIESSFLLGINGNGRNLGITRLTTNSAGTVVIPHATPDLKWHAQIRATGFQKERFKLNLHADKTTRIVLKSAMPGTLSVTSSEDGRPVENVLAYIVRETYLHSGRSYGDSVFYGRHWWGTVNEPRDVLLYRFGPSDVDGQIVLDCLAENTRYDLEVVAKGFAPKVIRDHKASTEPVNVELWPELTVAGRIVGDLSTLRTDRKTKKRFFQYSYLNHGQLLKATVDGKDGTGRFRIDGLGPGELKLRLPGRTIVKDLTDSVDDLVIDLDELSRTDTAPKEVARDDPLPEPKGRSRKVILTLTGADPSVTVSGQLRAGYVTRDRPGVYSSANFDIVNSRVEFDVEVPTRIHWLGKNFQGYSVVDRSEIEVGVSDDPFHADVELLPAGAVRGDVHLADGSLARDFQVDVMSVEPIKTFSGKNQRVYQPHPAGRFLLTDVPLGHEYRVLVTDDRPNSVAAVMSKPFRLDDSHPIADLNIQIEEGRGHIIKLVDENGEPASGAKAGGWFRPGKTFSRSMGFRVQDNGELVLKHVSSSIPGTTTLQVKAAGGFVGQSVSLDWDNLPDQLMLKRGVTASGRLVDAETGRGIANASFFLFPQPSKAATFREAITTKTDEEGRFSFDSLEPVNYMIHLHGAVPPRVPLVKNDRGVVEPDYTGIKDGTFPEWFIQGGETKPYLIKAKILPKRGLKLAPPNDNSE